MVHKSQPRMPGHTRMVPLNDYIPDERNHLTNPGQVEGPSFCPQSTSLTFRLSSAWPRPPSTSQLFFTCRFRYSSLYRLRGTLSAPQISDLTCYLHLQLLLQLHCIRSRLQTIAENPEQAHSLALPPKGAAICPWNQACICWPTFYTSSCPGTKCSRRAQDGRAEQPT